jgi:hypothetical protein
VGFPSYLLRENNISDGRLEVQFVGSRDGITWHRYDRAPYAAPGLEGTENANVVLMDAGLAVRGDEIWQYGLGLRSRHGDMVARKRQTDGSIRRYVQRLDGFVSADFAPQGGRFVTPAVHVTGECLQLNVDTGALGELRVALLDAHGEAIPGFTAEDCQPVHINATGTRVCWKEHTEFTGFAGREVRIAFCGSRTKLYSFSFAAACDQHTGASPSTIQNRS